MTKIDFLRYSFKIVLLMLMMISCDKDDKVAIINTLEYLTTQNLDYIITTGGLGRTEDDKTKDALNNFLLFG